MDPQITIETFTPASAKDAHGLNFRNRHVVPSLVRRYAEDMANGNWELSGAPVVFDEHGALIDGQHRMLACIQADVPFTTVVVRGVAEQAKDVLDTGKSRTLGDLLRWREEKNYNNLAATVRYCWRWCINGVAMSRPVPSNRQALAWLADHPDVRDAVELGGEFHKRGGLRVPPSVVAAFAFRASSFDAEAVEDFYQLLNTGAGHESGSGPLGFRNWVLNTVGQMPQGNRPANYVYLAYLIKAWNLWITGDTRALLRWARGGKNREPFPAIVNSDGLALDFGEVAKPEIDDA
jgi:hypothetical protein